MGRTMLMCCWCGVMAFSSGDDDPVCGAQTVDLPFSTSFLSFDFWLSPSSLEELMSAKFFSSIFYNSDISFVFFLSYSFRAFEFHIFFHYYYYYFPRWCGEKGVVAQRRLPTRLLFASILRRVTIRRVRLREQIQIKLTFSSISFRFLFVDNFASGGDVSA